MKKCVKLYGLLLLSLLIAGCSNKVEENINNDNTQVEELPKEELSVELKNTLKDKILMYSKEFSYLYPIDNLTDKIDNQILIGFAMSIYDTTHNHDPYTNGYMASSLDNIVYEYFGDSIKINHENYNCPYESKTIALYKYDSKNEKYKYNSNHLGHGYSAMADIKAYIIGGYKQGEDVVVETNMLYSNFIDIGEVDSYYASYEDSVKEENKVIKLKCNDSFECAEIKQSDYEKVKDKLPITTYKFKIEKDNYILKSIEINKVD